MRTFHLRQPTNSTSDAAKSTPHGEGGIPLFHRTQLPPGPPPSRAATTPTPQEFRDLPALPGTIRPLPRHSGSSSAPHIRFLREHRNSAPTPIPLPPLRPNQPRTHGRAAHRSTICSSYIGPSLLTPSRHPRQCHRSYARWHPWRNCLPSRPSQPDHIVLHRVGKRRNTTTTAHLASAARP